MSAGRDGFSKRKPKITSKGDTKSAKDLDRANPYTGPIKVAAAKAQPGVESKGDTKYDLKRKASASKGDTKSAKDLRRKPARPGDTKATRKELRAVKEFKKTQAYSGAVRQAYDTRGDRKGTRLAIARADYNLARSGRKDLPPESRSVLTTNKARRDRNEDLRSSAAKHDVVRPAELSSAAAERERHADHLQKKDPVRAYRIRRAGGAAGATDRAPLVNIGKTVGATAVAFKDEPVSVTKKTVKGGVEILKAVPAGIVDTITDPVGSVKDATRDYKRRYSGSFKARVKRIKKEGAAAELVDAVGLATLGGATAGRGLANTAKKGALGPKAKAVVSDPRPKLRTSGGTVKEQSVSGNYFKATLQRKHDKARARKGARALAAAKAGKPSQDAVRVQAARAGEVARLRPEKISRGQARAVAKTKSAAVALLKAEQARKVDQGARKALAALNKHERKAFYYVGVGIAAADKAKFATALEARKAKILAERERDGVTPEGLLKRTDEVRAIEKLQANLDKVDLTKVRDIVAGVRNESIKVGRADPALRAEQRLLRRYAQQAETLGVRRGEADPLRYDPEEKVSDFIKRVQTKADEAGLERPVYFPSERYAMDVQPDFSSRAVGGSRGVRSPFAYTGENYRLGQQDIDPEVFLTGMSRNIKRKHNWELVDKLVKQHAITGLKAKPKVLKDVLSKRGVDPSSYVLWNPKVYRERLQRNESDHDALVAEGNELVHGRPEDAEAGRVAAAMAAARDASGEFREDSGWVAVPKAAWKEIEDSAKPSGAIGRSFDVFKSKQSRLLLGSLNIPWLQFQVAANGLLTGFATKGAGVTTDLVKAQVWWKKLTPEQQDEVNALMGSSSSFDANAPKLGAATNASIVNGWRALKALPVWDRKVAGHGPSLRQLNPIEAMFGLDRAQNAVFRRTLLYNQVKREAFQRMGENMSTAQKLQTRVNHALTLGPEQAMQAILKDRDAVERHAEKVNEWLGDYTTYTAAERKTLARGVMFYGFLRYSLKFTLYTMPVKHPIQSAIIAKLGQLEREEIKELLGGDNLPWAWGKLYLTKGGKLQSIDLAKANPAFNTLTSAITDKPSGWVSLAPPVVVALAEQAPGIGGRSFWNDRDWRVEGKPAPYAAKRSSYGKEASARVFADRLGSMLYPYRLGERLQQDGVQGDDSMLNLPFAGKDGAVTLPGGLTLGGEREVGYKRDDIRRAINKQKRHDAETKDLLHELVPFIPRESRDDEIVLERNIAEQAKKKPKAEKRPAKRSYFGHGGRNFLGPGGSR